MDLLTCLNKLTHKTNKHFYKNKLEKSETFMNMGNATLLHK